MEKGILIVAVGHPNYYRMAENLAASLRVNQSEDLPIQLICDDPGKVRYLQLFSICTKVEADQFTRDGKTVFNKLMVELYWLSAFKTTIKLDADMIWLPGRDPMELFKSLNNVDLAFMNRGHGALQKGSGYSVWADEDEIRKVYKLGPDVRCYKIFGEFLYFRKNRQNERYFKLVRDIYSKRKVAAHGFSNDQFTDELAYQVACMQLEVYPHEENFTPVFNRFLGYLDKEFLYPYQLPSNFYAFSIGGNSSTRWAKTQYDILANHYFKKLGLQNPYHLEDKRSFLPERQKL
jgi:hypothetical protein